MKLFLITFFLLIILNISIQAAMLENLSPQLGETSWIETGNSDIAKIDNSIALIIGSYTFITIDVENNRIIDTLNTEPYILSNSAVLFLSDGSYALYFNTNWTTKTNYMGKTTINSKGEFTSLKILTDTYSQDETGRLLSDNINKKVWHFGKEKIEKIDPQSDEITKLDYPASWKENNREFNIGVPILSYGSKYIVCLAKIYEENGDSFYSYLQIDIENSTVSEFFIDKRKALDFNQWIGHETESLIINDIDYCIYSFDHLTLTYKILIEANELFGLFFLTKDGTKGYTFTDFESSFFGYYING